jgi:hypothetical protein
MAGLNIQKTNAPGVAQATGFKTSGKDQEEKYHEEVSP